MEEARKALEILEPTLRRYRENKTKVPKADLDGKYRDAFQKLKGRLKEETEDYLRAVLLSGFQVLKSDGDGLVDAIERSIAENQIPRRAGRAVFRNFSLQELQEIAWEQRQRIQELYDAYFRRHICLYVTESSLAPDSPQPPLIYNDIVDKFWDDGAGEWTSREKPSGDAVLIFIRQKEKEAWHEKDG